jgi:hypothetical protein
MFSATITMPNAPERFEDPLFELWLPRLTSGEFATTGAWLRWGLDGLSAMVVLATVCGVAGLALALSFARPAFAKESTGRAIAIVTMLVLAFAFPFPPLAPIALGWPGDGAPPQVVLGEIGHTERTVGGVPELELWARIENRGGAIRSSRLGFAVWRTSGEGVWAAYYGDVPIPSNARHTVTITWHPENVPPGTYRYGLTVTDAASHGNDATLMAGDLLSVGR